MPEMVEGITPSGPLGQRLGKIIAEGAGGVAQAPGSLAPAGLAHLDEALPFRVMEKLGGSWLSAAPLEERFDTLLELLRVRGHSDEFIEAVQRQGPKLLKMPQTKIPASLVKMAGSAGKRASFTQSLELTRMYRGGVPTKVVEAQWKRAIEIAKGGLKPRYVEALRKSGPSMMGRFSAAQVLATYEESMKSPGLVRVWRKYFGKGTFPGGAPDSLPEAAKTAWTETLGTAPRTPQKFEPLPEGAGRAARGYRAAEEGVEKVRGKLQPGELPVQKEVLKGLRGAKVKGVGRLAKAARGMRGLGPVAVGGFVAWDLYNNLVGRQKAARSALDAYNAGQGRSNMSMEIIREVLEKREAIDGRKALLLQDPNMSQQVIQALSEISGGGRGRAGGGLARGEVGLGTAAQTRGGPKLSGAQMDALLDRLMMQLEGV